MCEDVLLVEIVLPIPVGELCVDRAGGLVAKVGSFLAIAAGRPSSGEVIEVRAVVN